ncbi:protein phosphatase CheZ [Microvirga rosea]|uniref:protein phosphatase CheZ n=1 Tax=Microvirga rosea TaxID=2715425 RepID=UPI001D0AB974|nr:protein phosphatase CheZ [Microvirga rosea]MCB8823518.1 protein phosphatase CheZ [Microvirga rosea]
MNSSGKIFQIEQYLPPASANGGEGERHAEIIAELAALRGLIEPTSEASKALLENLQHDMQEAFRLKAELDAIMGSIVRTKAEIATLHYAGAQGREISTATDELGAVVMGTEAATHTILEAAESIDAIAADLSGQLTGIQAEAIQAISDKVVTIFEACNFQDITGQRIGKVISSMRFVEDRVGRMIEIWGGIESFNDVAPEVDPNREGDRALLNGPALDVDPDKTSQDEIDALFN